MNAPEFFEFFFFIARTVSVMSLRKSISFTSMGSQDAPSRAAHPISVAFSFHDSDDSASHMKIASWGVTVFLLLKFDGDNTVATTANLQSK
jgi:hypothetical protein